ncbi:MAG: DUF2336 domain-containing protein [Xanthobacteraceae bacterium]|jgi:uncharacterized protein (DUF2336 family)
MGAALSLIPELEAVIAHGSRHKRVETLQRMTTLFLAGASRYSDEHVDLFDDVFGHLIAEIETKARAELAHRLAPLHNAPTKVLRTLAHDDDIAVAGPVLQGASRLHEADLVDLARTKGQAHLQAISTRHALGEAVTDILVRRGDRDVVRSVAGNRGARISDTGFIGLIKRAESDGILAETVGLRPDIPPQMFRELLTRATAVVRERLLASAPPELKAEIRRVLKRVSQEVGARVGPRDYRAAQRVVLSLHRAGRMDEAALATFAHDGKYEETVAALAALSKVPINVVDPLMAGERPDPVLILCKAAGIGWPTVKSVISANPDIKQPSSEEFESAFANYGRLSAPTAQRVVRFWQVKRIA